MTSKYLSYFGILFLLAGCSPSIQFATTANKSSGGNSSSSIGSGSGTGSSAGSGSGNCQLQNVTVPVKIMFVVDTSGSNSTPTQNRGTLSCNPSVSTCSPPTDPNKTFRSGSISQFFNIYSAKTNLSWGFITFSNGQTQAIINSGSAASPIFANAAVMQNAITQFNAILDSGDTPYLLALSQVKTAIGNDPGIKLSGASAPLYYVVFLSDGYPTDALNSDGSINQGLIQGQIQQIVALAPSRIHFSTVYYGTINDPTAAGLLQQMAQVGQGTFVNVDTQTVSTLNIQDLIQVQVGNCN